ncbi:plasma protease C1 inhibitor [Lissotriton helveticus]
MRLWLSFLALAALCCPAIADEKALPDSTSAAGNTATGIKCPPPRDYKIFQRKGESFVEITASLLPQSETDRETSGSSVTDHQTRPDVAETEGLVNSSHQQLQQERPPENTDLHKPQQDRPGLQEQKDNEQKSEHERRDSAGETEVKPQNTTDEKDLEQSEDMNSPTSRIPSNESSHQVQQTEVKPQNTTDAKDLEQSEDRNNLTSRIPSNESSHQVQQTEVKPRNTTDEKDLEQSEDRNNLTSRIPSNESSHQVQPEPKVIHNETEEDSPDYCEHQLHSTDEVTTTIPSTTQEPTTVTTEDPNWCRQNRFVKPWPQCADEAERNDTKNLAEDLTKFSFRLFHQVLKKDRTANVIFSPLSIVMVLSQLLLGARGDTKDNLLDALFALKSSESDCVHSTLGSMVASQGFKSASGMFYQKDLNMNPFFLNQSEELYKVTPQPLTESPSANLKMVNTWVAQHTNNRIKKLLDEIPPNVKLLLLNAIFFQGKWKTRFNPKETLQQSFWGISKRVPMMTSKKYPLVSVSDPILKARVARFPLSDDMSMLIFLPHIGHLPLTEMEEKFTADVLQAVLEKLDRSHVNPHMVSLPKFKVDSTQDLVALFSNVGLSDLLGSANLCGISDSEELMVSGGQHRALLQMDEAGVVAAAATAVSLARTVYVFDVRHPFIFVVWSERSRIPVMMGRIADPKA